MTSPVPSVRVLYVVSLFPCWSETFIVREIVHLQKLGADVRILSLKHASEHLVQSDARALLDRVIYPPTGWQAGWSALLAIAHAPGQSWKECRDLVAGLWRRPEALAKSLVAWWRTLAVLPQVRACAPQRLHAHWATYPSSAAMWLSARLSLPYSFTAHAHDIFLEDHLLAQKLQTAAFGVTISEYNRRWLAQRVSSRALQSLRVVHCGVSPDQYQFQADGRQPGRLLSVGRLDAIKGFEHLIDACALLATRGVAFDCEIIGEGPLRQSLQTRINAHGLQDRVRLRGACAQEQVREALHAASVFVLASVVTPAGDRDGIPVALMEAMACGAPVVSTRVSGIPELVSHGVEGLLADPADARSLADCIARQLQDGAHAVAMARAARRKVENDFNVAREAEKLHAAFV
jgi:glycosyltransferase involved in cell wall biosynthesis